MNSHQTNFQPTSLDFINRPNPVEPSDVGHSHETSSSKQLEGRANGGLIRVLRDSGLHRTSRNIAPEINSGRSQNLGPVLAAPGSGSNGATRHGDSSMGTRATHVFPRDSDSTRYTLPPPAQQGTKRPRHQVPPVLQGLHQPPPNAGLLPSIDANNRRPIPQTEQQTTEVSLELELPDESARVPTENVVVKLTSNVAPRPTRRNKWTDEETHALLQGIRQYGVGRWKKILTCSDWSFNQRTATDLKDRFRVVSSNKDMLLHYKIYAEYVKDPPDLTQAGHLAAAAAASESGVAVDPPPTGELDLPRAKRRQRTKWSEEEDSALLKGFGRYGPSWSSIQLDPVLKKRTPTDIRDRVRTRYSEEYTKAGLAPKPAKPRVQMRSQPRPTAGDPTTSSTTSAPHPSSTRSPTAAHPVPSSAMQSTLDDPWGAEMAGPIDASHPLAHLLNSSDDASSSLRSLPSLLLPRIGQGENDQQHQLQAPLQSINPLVTVLGRQ